MKKIYNEPLMEITTFKSENVMTTSMDGYDGDFIFSEDAEDNVIKYN